MNAEVLGIDIGGVIIDRVNDGTDTSFFSDNYLKTTAVPDAFVSIRRLVEEKFGSNVFLVSKCGSRVQEKTLRWLDYHRFFEATEVPRDHIRFCLERHQKAGICAALNVSHFIDDRLEVLNSLTTVNTLYLFRPRLSEIRRFGQIPRHITQVNSWQEILNNERL